jgi:hypothetical protein
MKLKTKYTSPKKPGRIYLTIMKKRFEVENG